MTTGTRTPSKWLFYCASVLAIGVVLIAYSNSFENSFHFDDSHVVEGNIYIRSLKNIPKFFQDPYTYSSLPSNAGYRPLVPTTLALDYWLAGGLKVRQFHRTQLAMLLLLGVGLVFLFRRILSTAGERWWTSWAALVAATLYSVHTTNTETLNIIHVRSELIANLGIVASFLVYFRLGSRGLVYLLPMIVAALGKEQAVFFAPLFLVYLLLFEHQLAAKDVFSAQAWPKVRAALLKSLPAFVAGAGIFLFMQSMNSPTLVLGGGTRTEYLRTQLFHWFHYFRLFFVPLGLSADTDWGLIPHWYDTRVAAGILFIALLLVVVWTTSMTPRRRPIAFGVAWYMLALMPASSIFPLAEATNDHRPFFAYIGLSLAVVWAGALLAEGWFVKLPRWGPAIAGAVVAVALLGIGGNAAGTYQRNKVFVNEETLFRDVVEKSPANGRGLMNYGLTQMEKGRYQEAKQLFERAAVYTPNYSVLEINLAIVSGALGDVAAAEAHFNRALQLRPGDSHAHFFYARWLTKQSRTQEAIDNLEKAVAFGPADIEARHLLLSLYAKAGRSADARTLAQSTLALAPDDAVAAAHLEGRGEEVSPPKSSPDVEPARALLEDSLRRYQAGDFEGCIDTAKKAIVLQPDYPEAYNNIAAAHASLGQWDEAIVAAREALRLRPDFPLARNNLAWAEREKKQSSKESD